MALTCWNITRYSLSALNTSRPLSSSCSTHPSAYRSVLGVTWPPRTCSGDMYWYVPMGLPVAVSLVTSVRRIAAMPKSSTFTVPSFATRMLLGFRSRWMTGTSCAYDSTVATCAATATAQLTGRGRSGWM